MRRRPLFITIGATSALVIASAGWATWENRVYSQRLNAAHGTPRKLPNTIAERNAIQAQHTPRVVSTIRIQRVILERVLIADQASSVRAYESVTAPVLWAAYHRKSVDLNQRLLDVMLDMDARAKIADTFLGDHPSAQHIVELAEDSHYARLGHNIHHGIRIAQAAINRLNNGAPFIASELPWSADYYILNPSWSAVQRDEAQFTKAVACARNHIKDTSKLSQECREWLTYIPRAEQATAPPPSRAQVV